MEQKKKKEKKVEVKCEDRNCPIHNSLKTRGRSFTGEVISDKMQGTVVVRWDRKIHNKKYEREDKARSQVSVHNPKCIGAKKGDLVGIEECRPLSKTKAFVVTKIVGEEAKCKE